MSVEHIAANATTAMNDWINSVGHTNVVSASVLLGLISFIVYPLIPSTKKLHPDTVEGLDWLSFTAPWSFFTKRFDFLHSNFLKSGRDMYRFKVFQHGVVAVRGEKGRKAFFDDKSLSFGEGHKLMIGVIPDAKDLNESEKTAAWFNKQLAIMTTKNRMGDMMPLLLDDIEHSLASLEKKPKCDVFEGVCDAVFKMIVRLSSCSDLADNESDLAKLQKNYWTLEGTATPESLVLPFLLSPGKIRKGFAFGSLYRLMSKYIAKRKAASVPTQDAIDILLSGGSTNKEIIIFVFAFMFAGFINTGVSASWAVVNLAFSPEWKAKVKAEVDAILAKYTDMKSNETVRNRLAMVPVSAWEDEMPAMELVIRETIRIAGNNLVALRRNILGDLRFNDKIVPKGDFMAYYLYDAHMNSDIFTNPMEFDPSRYEAGREEDKKSTYAFLGWGAGRHPCTGMKVAKLEIKLLAAFLLTGYEYDIVDKFGRRPRSPPRPDWNDTHSPKPIEPCFMNLRRKAT